MLTGQGEQVVEALLGENVSVGQRRHKSWPSAPGKAEKVPGGQGRQ